MLTTIFNFVSDSAMQLSAQDFLDIEAPDDDCSTSLNPVEIFTSQERNELAKELNEAATFAR